MLAKDAKNDIINRDVLKEVNVYLLASIDSYIHVNI